MGIAESGMAMAEMTRVMVSELVDRPEDVSVVVGKDGGFVLLTVSVAPRDMGRLIGGGGKTVRSIKAILGAVATRRNVRWELVILGEQPREERVS